MLVESGQVVSIESDCLWVETIQRSTCGSCVAQKGCGQSLLAKWAGRPHHLRVLLLARDASEFCVGDDVEVGIPESVVALGAVFIYLLPLVLLFAGAGVGQFFFGGELASILGAVVGGLMGAALIRVHAFISRNDPRLQPVLIERVAGLSHV